MKQFFYLISILLIINACKEVYEPPPRSLVNGMFFSVVDTGKIHTRMEKAISPSIIAQGVGLDNYLLNDSVSSNILLPLTIKDTTRYIIWLDTHSDSITFIHQTTQKFNSLETGFYYEYKLRAIRFTHNRIDSIKIVDSLVTTKWNENIKLYIHPLSTGGN